MTFPTTIMSLTGIDEINLASHSQIMKAMRPIELVLVMDTTGSMATDNKIDGAKTAARDLLNTVYGGTAGVRFRKANTSAWRSCPLRPASGSTRMPMISIWTGLTQRVANPLSKLNFNDCDLEQLYDLGQVENDQLHISYMEWLRRGAHARRLTVPDTDYNVNDVAPTIGRDAVPGLFCAGHSLIRQFGCLRSPMRTILGAAPIFAEDGTPNEITGTDHGAEERYEHRRSSVPPGKSGQIPQPEHWRGIPYVCHRRSMEGLRENPNCANDLQAGKR